MQHIGISLQDEKGKIVKNSPINFVDILIEVFEVKDFKKKYPTMSIIDPYADTVFNGLQIKNFIDELNSLSSEVKNNKKQLLIQDIISFAKNADHHDYIKLIGD